jgi:hypothetical protein
MLLGDDFAAVVLPAVPVTAVATIIAVSAPLVWVFVDTPKQESRP